MKTFKRFTDENYKNWLKTAESLYILRRHICEFVENETETYHRSLRERLKGEICVKECTIKTNPPPGKKLHLCHHCERWKGEILENHLIKGNVHWTNCQPYLWPTEKWEVAKAYMPRTPKDHRCFNQFDIAGILNLMDHCKHFRTLFKSQFLNSVIKVRNQVMHSPELRLSKANMEKYIEDVVKLSKVLEPHAPGLKGISEEIQQFGEDLEKYCGQSSLHAEDSKEENLKLMNIEHQALKEKIEFLSQCYEDQQHAELKKELQGMKSFLEQNKDLLENLGPHVTQLDEIQEKVNKHDQQIDNLENRVDKLEKETQETMFIGAPLKFKNHLFEEAKKRKWPDPIFSEVSEANGYRGQVEVNGQIFKSSHVYNSKKDAHQEVAKKALDQIKACRDSTEDHSQSGRIDAASSSNALFYASATVVLKNQEVVSDGCAHEEDAVESAYKKLACLFGLNVDEEGSSFKEVVLAHFGRCHYPVPSEHLDQQDEKNFCKLHLCGSFTFHDKDGSIKKKQAEQQAAMVALQQLSGILNCSSEAVDDGNYKGFLKECLDAHGLKQPSYTTERKEGIGEELEGPNASGDNPHRGFASLQPEDSAALVQPPSTTHTVDDDVHLMGIHGTHTPPIPSTQAKMECTEINTLLAMFNLKPPSVTIENVSNEEKFTITVEVNLNNLTIKNKDPCSSRKDAIRKAYYLLGCALGICQSSTDATMLVKQDFSQKSFPLPKEVIESKMESFYCSLMDISYDVVYEGQGSTEADARRDGLQKVLFALPLLFGYESLPSSGSAEEMEAQITAILKNKGQKDLVYSLQRHQHKSSTKLLFKDYSMESTRQANKKANRSHLSRRILGLLGEKTEPNHSSVRNCLDEWFRKRDLQLPVYEDTAEPQGSRATFSVSLSCSNTDWADSLEAANEKLAQELSNRFRYLNDRDEY